MYTRITNFFLNWWNSENWICWKSCFSYFFLKVFSIECWSFGLHIFCSPNPILWNSKITFLIRINSPIFYFCNSLIKSSFSNKTELRVRKKLSEIIVTSEQKLLGKERLGHLGQRFSTWGTRAIHRGYVSSWQNFKLQSKYAHSGLKHHF